MIKLLTGLVGRGVNHSAGDIVTLDPPTEARMVSSGQAEPVAPPDVRPTRAKKSRAQRVIAQADRYPPSPDAGN